MGLCGSTFNGSHQSWSHSLSLPEKHLTRCDHQHVCLWVHVTIRHGGSAAVGSCSLQRHGCCIGAGAPGSLH